MQLGLPKNELDQLVARQLGSLFIWKGSEENELRNLSTRALEKCESCFSCVAKKYYRCGIEVYFDPFHSVQYTFYLYQLAHLAWKDGGNSNLAARLYYLNKALNGLDLFYEVDLPALWICDHPVGTVIGRGVIGNRFYFGQNVTVGNNNGHYPVIEENVTLMSGSSVLGQSKVGSGVIVSAKCLIKDEVIPINSLVFGMSPNLIIKPMREEMMTYHRNRVWTCEPGGEG